MRCQQRRIVRWGQVIGYSKGTQHSSEEVGQIPANYTQGSGTFVSGTTADKATEAALAAYQAAWLAGS
jgi:hypothetical protein